MEKKLWKLNKQEALYYKQNFLVKLLKNLPTDTVEIEVQNHLQTDIRSGKSEFNLNGLDAEEYPSFTTN